MKVKVLTSVKNGGRVVPAGQYVSLSDADAEQLAQLGHVELPAENQQADDKPQTGDQPEEPEQSEAEKLAGSKNRDKLNKRAKAAGVEKPEDLPNKLAVAEAILKAESDEESAEDGNGNGDEDDDEGDGDEKKPKQSENGSDSDDKPESDGKGSLTFEHEGNKYERKADDNGNMQYLLNGKQTQKLTFLQAQKSAGVEG